MNNLAYHYRLNYIHRTCRRKFETLKRYQSNSNAKGWSL